MRMIIYSIIILLFTNCARVVPQSEKDNSIVVIKLAYNSPGVAGFGGCISLKNIDTGQKFNCQKKIGFSSYAAIPNVPPGQYQVEELNFSAGNLNFKIKDAKFDTIVIDQPSIYFLGSYIAKYSSTIRINKKFTPNVDEIVRPVREKTKSWIGMKVDYTQKLFTENR